MKLKVLHSMNVPFPKRLLVLSFLVAFLFAGVPKINAQTSLNLVDESVAITLLQQELANVYDNLSIANEKTPTYKFLSRKLNYYVAVYEELHTGSSVADAISNNYKNLLTNNGTGSGFAQGQLNTKDVSDNDQVYQDIVSLLED